MEKPQKQSPTLLQSVADRLTRLFRKDAPSEDHDSLKETPAKSTETADAHVAATVDVTVGKNPAPQRRKSPCFDDSVFQRSVADMPSDQAKSAIEQLVTKQIGNLEFDVVKMAAQLRTSRTNLYLIMRREYGMTPAGFIMEQRIRHALSLLDSGSTVRETCFKCGFADPKYFSKVFRKYQGMLPSQYIEKKQK